MNKLLEAYSGDRAKGYDARREKSARWRNEIAAMEALLVKAGGTKVLDCPFGTGRWIPQYIAAGLKVVGVDLSAAMLEEARAKVAELADDQASQFELIEGSIFDLSPDQMPQGIDLVACIRFINWISFSDLERVVPVLTTFGTNKMILGASVIPEGTGGLRRWWYEISLNLINKRHPERPVQYVHDEAALVDLLAKHGWRVADQREIMRRNARVNYFYLLEQG